MSPETREKLIQLQVWVSETEPEIEVEHDLFEDTVHAANADRHLNLSVHDGANYLAWLAYGDRFRIYRDTIAGHIIEFYDSDYEATADKSGARVCAEELVAEYEEALENGTAENQTA